MINSVFHFEPSRQAATHVSKVLHFSVFFCTPWNQPTCSYQYKLCILSIGSLKDVTVNKFSSRNKLFSVGPSVSYKGIPHLELASIRMSRIVVPAAFLIWKKYIPFNPSLRRQINFATICSDHLYSLGWSFVFVSLSVVYVTSFNSPDWKRRVWLKRSADCARWSLSCCTNASR